MIKKIFNKKKTSINSILKFTLLIILVIVFVVVFQQFYKSSLVKKKLFDLIEIYSQNYEYSLKEIKINKLNHIDYIEIEKYFTQYYDRSIFLIPIQDILKMLNQKKWIDAVTIKSDYKNTISVIIRESSPKGIYYNGENYFFFDKNQKIIDFVNPNFSLYPGLIKFKGNNSLSNANLFLKSIPLSFKNKINEAIFINNRRWDIQLKNDIKLKLAENKVSESLNNYDRIYRNLSNQELQEIELIDLRITKRAVLKFKKQQND